jgi:hypothetical protein
MKQTDLSDSRVTRVLVPAFLAVLTFVAIALTGCANPIATTPSTKSSEIPVHAETPFTGYTADNPDPEFPNTYLLEFPLPEKSASQSLSATGRSLVNHQGTDSTFMADINYYQLIAINTENPNDIWATASSSGAEEAGKLRIVVEPGKTYHLLLLHGHKNDSTNTTENPVLLASGYIKYKILSDSNQVTIRMVPVLTDVTITKKDNLDEWAVTEKNIA